MNSIQDLLKDKELEKKESIQSERAEVLKFFIDGVKDKNGKPYRPGFIASKLSIYSLQDLHYMISDCKLNWDGNIGKYFWCLFKKK